MFKSISLQPARDITEIKKTLHIPPQKKKCRVKAYRNSWSLDARVRRWTLNSGLWMLDPGRWTLDAGLWMLDAGLWTLDAGRWTLDAGLWILDSGH